VGERVVMVVLEGGMGKRMVGGVVLEGINGTIGVDSIARGRRGRAYRILGARGDEDRVVPSPRRLLMRIREFGVDSARLLRVVHRSPIHPGCR
jgi:hypothetical protein